MNYTEPTVEVVEIGCDDIIQTSGLTHNPGIGTPEVGGAGSIF